MANIDKYIEHLALWEGTGYYVIPGDKGGPTKFGVTLNTYRQFFGMEKTAEDLKNMSMREWKYIFIYGFWGPVKADSIENQSLATLIMDCCYMSGRKTSIKKIQRCLGGLDVDGIVGPKTLRVLNDFPEDCFYKIYQMRLNWFKAIVEKDPTQKKFLRGWLNRLNSVKYIPTELQDD